MTQNSASVLSIDSSEILLSFDECQIFGLKLFKRVIVLREISDAWMPDGGMKSNQSSDFIPKCTHEHDVLWC